MSNDRSLSHLLIVVVTIGGNDRGHDELRRLFYEAIDPSYVVE